MMRGKTVAYAEAKQGGAKDGTGDGADKAAEPKADEPTESELARTMDHVAEPPAEPKPKEDAKPPEEPKQADKQKQPRAHSETIAMPSDQLGKPPELPTAAPAQAPVAAGAVESPTHMPQPRDVPGGNPDDAAPPPGHVPPGDSRSLRNGDQFALVYRLGTFVISRFGTVGKRGQWRVVEYPTSSSASHSYAKECSRFVSEGFSDYRD